MVNKTIRQAPVFDRTGFVCSFPTLLSQRQQWQWFSDDSGKRVKAFARVRIESLPYQLDGSVLGYHGNNGYEELGFDSGEGA